MRTTNIEWTEHTWNPFVGCTIHTAGCSNCYAMRQARRIEGYGHAAYQGVTRTANGQPVWTGKINRATDAAMLKPTKIKTPSRIFVNSMSDFFHPHALDAWRLEALSIMLATPQHAYQILTKRPEEVAPFLRRSGISLPDNFWLGATVERGDFTHRIDTLRTLPAAIRFLSIEPLIGPIGTIDLSGIHWVIIGGESGPGARPMRAEWAREVRDQCAAQHVALFFKQWGKAENNPKFPEVDEYGKGGGILDGKLWREYPAH